MTVPFKMRLQDRWKENSRPSKVRHVRLWIMWRELRWWIQTAATWVVAVGSFLLSHPATLISFSSDEKRRRIS